MSRDMDDARERGPLPPQPEPSHPANHRAADSPPRHFGGGRTANLGHRSPRSVPRADRRLVLVLTSAALLGMTGGVVLAGRKGIVLGAVGAALVAVLAGAARQVLGGGATPEQRVPSGADSPSKDVTEPVRNPASNQPPRRPPGTAGRTRPPDAGADARPVPIRDAGETDGRPPGERPGRRSREKHDVPPGDDQPADGKIRTSDGLAGFPVLNVRSRAAAQPWRLPSLHPPEWRQTKPAPVAWRYGRLRWSVLGTDAWNPVCHGRMPTDSARISSAAT